MKKLATAACVLSLIATASEASYADSPYNISPAQYCKGMGLSTKKIPGQTKSPYAQCVSAMARMERTATLASVKACSSLKKGAKGTAAKRAATKAFSRCVAAGKKLRADQS